MTEFEKLNNELSSLSSRLIDTLKENQDIYESMGESEKQLLKNIQQRKNLTLDQLQYLKDSGSQLEKNVEYNIKINERLTEMREQQSGLLSEWSKKIKTFYEDFVAIAQDPRLAGGAFIG